MCYVLVKFKVSHGMLVGNYANLVNNILNGVYFIAVFKCVSFYNK